MNIASGFSGPDIFKYSYASAATYLHEDSKGDSNRHSPIIWGCDLFWGTHPGMRAGCIAL